MERDFEKWSKKSLDRWNKRNNVLDIQLQKEMKILEFAKRHERNMIKSAQRKFATEATAISPAPQSTTQVPFLKIEPHESYSSASLALFGISGKGHRPVPNESNKIIDILLETPSVTSSITSEKPVFVSSSVRVPTIVTDDNQRHPNSHTHVSNYRDRSFSDSVQNLGTVRLKVGGEKEYENMQESKRSLFTETITKKEPVHSTKGEADTFWTDSGFLTTPFSLGLRKSNSHLDLQSVSSVSLNEKDRNFPKMAESSNINENDVLPARNARLIKVPELVQTASQPPSEVRRKGYSRDLTGKEHSQISKPGTNTSSDLPSHHKTEEHETFGKISRRETELSLPDIKSKSVEMFGQNDQFTSSNSMFITQWHSDFSKNNSVEHPSTLPPIKNSRKHSDSTTYRISDFRLTRSLDLPNKERTNNSRERRRSKSLNVSPYVDENANRNNYLDVFDINSNRSKSEDDVGNSTENPQNDENLIEPVTSRWKHLVLELRQRRFSITQGRKESILTPPSDRRFSTTQGRKGSILTSPSNRSFSSVQGRKESVLAAPNDRRFRRFSRHRKEQDTNANGRKKSTIGREGKDPGLKYYRYLRGQNVGEDKNLKLPLYGDGSVILGHTKFVL